MSTIAEYGYIAVRLTEVMEQRGMSKNKLIHRAELERTQLNQYCTGKILRVDLAVLSRICHALDCRVEDILEYIPPQ
ncbi:MAG: helix-turn-helix domain-containing protein [Blautia sp.]